MASQLIRDVRLMIEAHVYDGASVDGFGADEFGNSFQMLIWQLLDRRNSDQEYAEHVKRGEDDSSRRLRDSIFLDSDGLFEEDRTLLSESINPPGRRSVEEVWVAMKERAKSAEEFGESIGSHERREALCSAETESRVELLLLKYALVAIAGNRTKRLSLDPLRIRQIEMKEGLKKTLQQAFLCWVFGFDQAAASLCGAAVENEIAFRLQRNEPPLIKKRGTKFWDMEDELVNFNDMLDIAEAKCLFGTTQDENKRISGEARAVLGLRNDALHHPDAFLQRLRLNGDFLENARDVLEAIQTP